MKVTSGNAIPEVTKTSNLGKDQKKYPPIIYSSDKLHQVVFGCASLPVTSHPPSNQGAGLWMGGSDVTVFLRRPGPLFFVCVLCLLYPPATHLKKIYLRGERARSGGREGRQAQARRPPSRPPARVALP